MEFLLYISAFIAAIAFVILVIYVVGAIKATKQTLNDVSETMQGIEKQIEGVTTETTQLLNKTNKLADDMGQKTTKLDSLFEGAKGVGDTLKDFNQSLSKLSSSISSASKVDSEKTAQAVKWGAAIVDFVNGRKNNKNK
ncbi:DUF948 domain-containing protein [Oceanobacillus senegalensis]|uniref:DUF948 domain-containing protein n=1 Tax=Oceanobacillus senegalensis TaxID=1936063 RepID=UPI000A314466|nr:DUF948 domain-containing protein [Oceanobacillus senegalensis]